MTIKEDTTEFKYNEMPVGFFNQNPPAKPGLYSYMPLRGMGHYEFQNEMKKCNKPKCTFIRNVKGEPVEINFIVKSCPEYGVIEIEDINEN